jgi:hypothetical protein
MGPGLAALVAIALALAGAGVAALRLLRVAAGTRGALGTALAPVREALRVLASDADALSARLDGPRRSASP